MTVSKFLAERVGEFAATATMREIPDEVLDRARHLILDAIGIAFTSNSYPFADVARKALVPFGRGEHAVIGTTDRLSARDAATLNGILIHGMDFDDTHLESVAHTTSAVLPAVMAAAVETGASTTELLLAYVLGVEVTARVGIGAVGGMHDVGFHPTAIGGAFGAAVASGRLVGLNVAGLTTAQGVVGSMAAGLMEFLEDGAWTKRLHPGWAAACGITAASFARAGWVGPPAVYEGRFGLYRTHLATVETRPDAVAEGLGDSWELLRVAVKPYPVCHLNHAFIDSGLALRAEYGLRPEDIEEITAFIHPVSRKIVCEPVESKWAPRSEYDAKFSLPFEVAAALVRGRFTLAELEDDALQDSEILDLARMVRVIDDAESAYPDAYSGALEVKLKDGRVVHHREQINRGHALRPLSDDEIVAKFRDNIGRVADSQTADRVQRAVLSLGDDGSAADFADACRISS